MDKSIEFLKTIPIGTKTIIVGCSGGPDSMALLHILYEEGYDIVCAHVDHNIRTESKEERQFVETYCQDHCIKFEALTLEKTSSNEFYYRTKRYTFYKELADKYDTPYIMTAHHGDDLIETVLMRISRGSTLKGYAGFPKIYDEGPYKIIKPLIFYTKSEILTYVEKNDIPYVIDSSNELDEYTRNRYRHIALPFLKNENPHVHERFLKYSERLEEAANFISESVTSAIEENYHNKTLDLIHFKKLNPFIAKAEMEYILRDFYGDDICHINESHLSIVLGLAHKNKNASLDLPKGLHIVKSYEELHFEKKSEEITSYEMELKEYNELPTGEITIVQSSEDTSNYITRLNSQDLALPLYIRTRRNGDKMEIKNSNGSKKIKSILIDEKIPVDERDTLPLVVDSQNRIVWLPGIRKSKFDINKDKKYDIILKYTQREEN